MHGIFFISVTMTIFFAFRPGRTRVKYGSICHPWIDGLAPIMRMIQLMMEEKAERETNVWADLSGELSHQPKCFFVVQLLFTPKHSCHIQLSEWKDYFLMYCPIQAESMGNWPVDIIGSHFLPTSEWDMKIFHYCVPGQCFSTLVLVMGILEIKSDKIFKTLRVKKCTHMHKFL